MLLLNPYRFGERDPFFANVVLLLDGQGANGSQTFVDRSTYARAQSVVSAAEHSTAVKKWGSTSIRLPSGYIDYADSADFTLGTSDWCVDLWVYLSSNPTQSLICGQANSAAAASSASFSLQVNSNKFVGGAFSGSSNVGSCTGTTTVTTGVWYYVRYGREGSTFRLIVDGVQEATATSSASLNNSTNKFALGRLGEFATNPMNGYAQDFRFTVGAWRGTSVPTGPVPLM